MGDILAKVLFSVGGRVISVKTILKLIGIVIVAVLIYLAYTKVTDHFEMIDSLKVENEKLDKENGQLLKDLSDAVRINEENQTMWQTEREGREAATKIGNDEQADSAQRNLKYKDLQNEIKASPVGPEPVDPLIQRTLDRVWG